MSTPAAASASNDVSLRFTPSLHPHLIITAFPPPTTPPNATCALHLALTLPDLLFPDPDELSDLWKPAGTPNLSPEGTPGCVHWAVEPSDIDVERPARDGEEAVELLLIVEGSREGTAVHVDVPLHVRYLPPNAEGGWDVLVFDGGAGGGSVRRAWVCEDNGDTTLLSGHDATSGLPVGILEDVHASTDLTLRLPAARPEYRVAVELVTAAVVWGGWAFLAWKIVRMGWGGKRGRTKGSSREKGSNMAESTNYAD